LLPQAQGDALLEDAKAAYDFAQSLGGGARRKVIVGGASAGAHPLLPPTTNTPTLTVSL